MINKKIEKLAKKILSDVGVTSCPVDMQKVAQHIGVDIKEHDLGSDVSGVLVIDARSPAIGVNAFHPKTRQKFTIAHEIGHFVLHKDDQQELFVDKSFRIEFRRNTGVFSKKEWEANAFAAALTMPDWMVYDKVETHNIDFSDGNSIKVLADEFGVSQDAMAIRIANLFNDGYTDV